MKFSVVEGQPIVDVILPARTIIDRRMRKLDESETLPDILEAHDHTIEWGADCQHRYVRGLPCRDCGETWNNLEDHPAIEYVTPRGGARYPSAPHSNQCSLCQGREKASEAFERLVTKNRREELDAYYRTKLVPELHQAVRYADKTAIGGRSFKANAESVAPVQPDLDGFSAVLVRAYDIDLATAAVGHPDFPRDAFVPVAVTKQLWPKERWHGMAMTMTDLEPIMEYQRKARLEAAARIDAEVQEYRAELESRQRA